MKKRAISTLLLCGLSTFSAVQRGHGYSSQPSEQPNILFIFADDWGYGDLGFRGHPELKTPNLDALVAGGIDIQQFTVANPVCSPSRVALMTGQYPARFGIHEHFHNAEFNRERGMPNWLTANAVMLPRLLQEAGYRTAHIGKWHLTSRDFPEAPLPEKYGYHMARVFNGPGPQVWSGIEKPANYDANFYKAFLTEGCVEHAMDFIEETLQTGQPFFINMWITETHTPIQATAAMKQPYEGIPEPEKTYYAYATNADKQLGRLFDFLEENGLRESTMIIFSSDNGPEVTNSNPEKPTYLSRGATAGLEGRKRSLLPGGVRVPFIVSWPEQIVAGGVDENSAVTAVDMLPTLSALAGACLPANYVSDGENRLDVILGEPSERQRPIFWDWRGTNALSYYWPDHAIRDGKWKLYVGEGGERSELYNYSLDPKSTNNLAAEKPSVVTEMRAKLDAWLGTLPSDIYFN